MALNDQIRQQPRIAQHIRPARFFGWFFGVNLPIAVSLSLLIQWHNSVVGQPEAIHLFMRAIVALGAFGIGLSIVYWKVFVPAIRQSRNEKNSSAAQLNDKR